MDWMESPLAAETETAEKRTEHGIRVSPYVQWKKVVDRVLAAMLLVAAVPVIGILVVVVRLTSKGPGIYRQKRIGRNGRPFTMYKIRTMRQDAEARTGAVWTVPGDARVTALGRVLRVLHLDELPQLVNVLRGEMSLVGPRPERPEFVEVLARRLPGYRDRLAVLPGITGLAQVNLPPDTDLDSVRRKLILDLEYVRYASLWLDLRLLAFTATRLFGLPGSATIRLFGLSREVILLGKDGSAREEGILNATPDSIARHASGVRLSPSPDLSPAQECVRN